MIGLSDDSARLDFERMVGFGALLRPVRYMERLSRALATALRAAP